MYPPLQLSSFKINALAGVISVTCWTALLAGVTFGGITPMTLKIIICPGTALASSSMAAAETVLIKTII
jgi:hypothetical protein